MLAVGKVDEVLQDLGNEVRILFEELVVTNADLHIL